MDDDSIKNVYIYIFLMLFLFSSGLKASPDMKFVPRTVMIGGKVSLLPCRWEKVWRKFVIFL